VDFGGATVSMSGPAGEVPVTVHPVVTGYGANSVVWEAGDLSEPTPGQDVTYTVSVSGVVLDGGQLPTHTYSVTLVAPDRGVRVAAVPTIIGGAYQEGTLSVSGGAYAPQPDRLEYTWLRDGSPITGTDSPTYQPRRADVGTRLSVRVIVSSPSHYLLPATVTTATTDVIAATTDASDAEPAASEFALLSGPRLKGTPAVGSRLRVVTGRVSPAAAARTVRWYRGSTRIRAAHGTRYRLSRKDRGARIRVQVRYTGPGTATLAVWSRRTARVR
jgi:hypothetical protein